MSQLFDRRALSGLPGLFRIEKDEPRDRARGKRVLQLLVPVALLGAAAAGVAFVRGHHATGTTDEIPWGLQIATYVFLAVSSTGLCLVASLGHVFGFARFEPVTKQATFLAWILLLLGFAVIGTELEHPLRLVRWVLLSPNPRSPIWWMGALYGVYFVLLTAELWFLLKHDHRRARLAAIPKLVAGVAASSNLGAVFALNHARPYWYGPFLPVYLIVTALVSGAALLVLLVYFDGLFAADPKVREEHVPPLLSLGQLLALFLGIWALFTAWRAIAGVAGSHPHLADVADALLRGPLFVSFWVFEVGLGMAIPLALLLVPAYRREPRFVALAASLPVLALPVIRYNMVYAGQAFSLRPVVGPLGEAISYVPPFKGDPAGFLSYVPSLVEVGVVAGAFALAVLVFVAGIRVFRLRLEA